MTTPFARNPKCDLCNLWKTSTCRAIPTRPSDFLTTPDYTRQALLVVGEAPGYHEDRQGKSWVGPTGQLLHQMLARIGLPALADIYLANTCRCRLPQGRSAEPSQIHACHDYLLDDIRLLYNEYSGRLTILCAGAVATKGLLGHTLTAALAIQGVPVLIPPDIRIPVFSTYHPAIVLGKEPTLVNAIRDHLYLLSRCLSGQKSQYELLEAAPDVAINPPDQIGQPILSLDIETYGAIKGIEQTVFHPVKSLVVDKIRPDQIIQTCALAWYTPDQEERSVVFDMQNSGHRAKFTQWLVWGWSKSISLLGQNLPFDLTYIRAFCPAAQFFLRPFGIALEDVMLWNFLHSELRPERSLKSIARLFSLGTYERDNLNAQSSADPKLWAYNALDAKVNLRARSMLIDAITQDYGPRTTKLLPLCHAHCSDLLWSIVLLTEAGVPFNPDRLTKLESFYEHRVRGLEQYAKVRGLLVRGKGSPKSQLELVTSALTEGGLMNHERLKLTDKKREISTSEDNIHLLAEYAQNLSPRTRMSLRTLSAYRCRDKIASTYLRPLLHDAAAGLVRGGICYPSWYACPSKHELDDKEGGTIQARITCRKPALQTQPPDIAECRTTRFKSGVVLAFDLSQIELRVAALLSGDPVMLDEYQKGQDRHAIQGQTLYEICLAPDLVVSKLPGWATLGKGNRHFDLFRQMGKTTNFLITFEGHADRLVKTILKDTGYLITLSQAQSVIDAFNSRYPVLRSWQSGLVAKASQSGYIELLTGWSRSFLGGPAACQNAKATILNFPVQTTAAQLTQSAQFSIQRCLLREGHRSVLDLNVYDALYIDCPPSEVQCVKAIVAQHLPHPPLLQVLEDKLGRTVPILYDTKELKCSVQSSKARES